MTLNVTNSFEVKTTVRISHDRVRDLLCCALEGGANYWYQNLELANPLSKYEEFSIGGSKRPPDIDEVNGWVYVAPFVEGEGTKFIDNEDEDGKSYIINLSSICRALSVMAEKYPTHFANFLSENDDAETGDVFLQCLAFGEVQYS